MQFVVAEAIAGDEAHRILPPDYAIVARGQTRRRRRSKVEAIQRIVITTLSDWRYSTILIRQPFALLTNGCSGLLLRFVL
jgi:hypothetical protein